MATMSSSHSNHNEEDDNTLDQHPPPKVMRSPSMKLASLMAPPPALTMASFASWDDSVISLDDSNDSLCASTRSNTSNSQSQSQSMVTFEDSFHASTTFSPDRSSPDRASRCRMYSLDSSPAETFAPIVASPLSEEQEPRQQQEQEQLPLQPTALFPPPRPRTKPSDLFKLSSTKSSKLFSSSLNFNLMKSNVPSRARTQSTDSGASILTASTSTTLPSCLRLPSRSRASSSDYDLSSAKAKRSSDSGVSSSTNSRKGNFTIFSDAAGPKKGTKSKRRPTNTTSSSLSSSLHSNGTDSTKIKAKEDRTALVDVTNSASTVASTSSRRKTTFEGDTENTSIVKTSRWSSLRTKDVLAVNTSMSTGASKKNVTVVEHSTNAQAQSQPTALTVSKPRLTMKTVMNATTFISGAAKAAAAAVSPNRERNVYNASNTNNKFSAVMPTYSHSRPPLRRSGDSSVSSSSTGGAPPPPPFALKRSNTSKLSLSCLKSSRRLIAPLSPAQKQAKMLEDLKTQKNDIIQQEREAMDFMKNAIQKTRLNFKDMSQAVVTFLKNMTFWQIACLSLVLYFVTGYIKCLHTVPLMIVGRVGKVILRWLKFVKSNRKSELKNLQRDSVSLRLFASKSSNKNKDKPLEKRIQKKLIGMAVARSIICKDP